MVKNLPESRRPGFDPWVGKIPWRRAWQPTPVFLPGEFQGQRNLAVYCPWGHKESDTKQLIHAHTRLSFSSDDGKRSERRKSTSTSRIQISSVSIPVMDHSKTERGPVSSTCLQALGWLIHL